MAYKLLGYLVWRGLKAYLRLRFPGAQRKLAIAGVAGLVLAGAVAAAQRQRASD